MAGRGGGNVGCEAGEGGVSFFAPVTICVHSEWDTNPHNVIVKNKKFVDQSEILFSYSLCSHQ